MGWCKHADKITIFVVVVVRFGCLLTHMCTTNIPIPNYRWASYYGTARIQSSNLDLGIAAFDIDEFADG